MHRRLSAFSLMLAWLFANGALLHTAQVFAWGQLAINFAHHLPATQAFVKTPAGCHECAICLAVEHAREDARQHPVPPENSTDSKLQLACAVTSGIILPRIGPTWPASETLAALPRTEPVPLPPPRSLG